MNAEGLLLLLRDVKFIETALGWVLSNFAENWQWYQRKSKGDKIKWMSIFTLGIGLLSTIAYYYAFGGDMALIDAIANLLYAWGMSLVGSQSRHMKRQRDLGR